MPHLLAIDDDLHFLTSLRNLVLRLGYSISIENNPHRLEEHLQSRETDCVLLDVKMPGKDGLELFQTLKSDWAGIPVIMISGQSTITIALNCIKLGAFDFIEKPVDPDRLLVALRNATENKSLTVSHDSLLSEIKKKYEILGVSKSIQNLNKIIRTVAPTDARVLILGETGTGKELVARGIHFQSNRRNKPFIKLNCASIPGELLESELFGFKKGSFTGAIRDQKGKFLQADQGTLFFDEIGDMSIALQAKLLRVLEEGEVELIGDSSPQKVNVRVLAATNRNLPELVSQGKFREDLFHRLNVVSVVIPPLRNRKDDIPILADFFLAKYADQYNKPVLHFSLPAKEELIRLDWKGNVRELRNLVEKLVIFSTSTELSQDEVSEAFGFMDLVAEEENPESGLKHVVENSEKHQILLTLNDTGWQIGETAGILGINRTTLFKKMKKYGIRKEGIG